MALPASIPPRRGNHAGVTGAVRPERALRVALDRRHPSCDDGPIGTPCEALADCPLAPLCTPPGVRPVAPTAGHRAPGGEVVPLRTPPGPEHDHEPARPPTSLTLAAPDGADDGPGPCPTPDPESRRPRVALDDAVTRRPVPALVRRPRPGLPEDGAADVSPGPVLAPGRRRGLTIVRSAQRDDRGQATAEYGLVILVAGIIALGVIAWARGTGAFTDLFEGVIDSLTAGF